MIIEILKTIRLLLKSAYFYIIMIVSLILAIQVSNNDWAYEGLKMIPSTIGVLLGGLLAVIAIIFSIVKDEEIKKLKEKYGDKFTQSVQSLKHHIISIIIYLLVSLLSFVLDEPSELLFFVKNPDVYFYFFFVFIEIFLFLLSLVSSLEVTCVLFLIFEIKFEMVDKSEKANIE